MNEMAIVWDLILLGVFAFYVIRGCWRGFVKSVLGAGRLILSTLLTVLLGSIFCRWLSETFAWAFSAVLGYILLFVLLFVGFTLLMLLVGQIVKLPVLKQCDKLLGFLFGALQGWLAVSLIATVVYAILHIGGNLVVYDESVIFAFVHKLNIFKFVIGQMV